MGSTGNNYSITWVTKKILTQEKHIFSVLSKSNVDEAKIQVERPKFSLIFSRTKKLSSTVVHKPHTENAEMPVKKERFERSGTDVKGYMGRLHKK